MNALNVNHLMELVVTWVKEKGQELHTSSVDVTPDTDLLATGILDSLGFVELIVFLEERTGGQVDLINIDPDEFTTLRGLCSHVLGNGVMRPKIDE